MRLFIKGTSTRESKDLKEGDILFDQVEIVDILVGRETTMLTVKHKDVNRIAIRNEDILNLAIKIIAKHDY